MNERDDEVKVTRLWQDYTDGRKYQDSVGLSKNLPRFVKFFEGDQWPAATEATKNLPRPQVNIIKAICRNKKAAILSVPVKLVYHADDETVDVEKFNNFAAHIQKEIGMEVIDKRAIGDGVLKGSYHYHFYWDAEANGKDGIREGGLRCELIDPLNIFYANPNECDEQKQKWILIASREDVESVRAKADADVDKDDIRSDEAEDKYGTVEQDGDKLCTVLTRYYRKSGEVYCEKATKNVIVNKPFPITPDVEGTLYSMRADPPNNSLPDKPGAGEETVRGARATLYPIVVGNYERRERCIYGLGEVEGLIPVQKAINFSIAMQLLNDQENAWGKYIVSKDALKGQKITNVPGQVLTDYSATGNGIRRLSGPAQAGNPLVAIETLISLTRVVTGTTEVMTGETLGASMSGAAIAQLQAQAQMPVEELRDTFWRVKEKQGKVLAQFFKLFYADREYSYEEERPVDPSNPSGEKEAVRLKDTFFSSEYRGVDFDVIVEATSGTRSSAAGDINALDALMARGQISVKGYLKAYPKDALANREEILKALEEDQSDALTRATAEIEQMKAQMAQYEAIIKSQEDTVNRVTSVISENQKLKEYLAKLYTEAKAKISEANTALSGMNRQMQQTRQDATDFANIIADQMEAGNAADNRA